MDHLKDDEEKDALIFDTGGGRDGSIKNISCYIFEYKNYQQKLLGCHDKCKGKVCHISNAVTKAWIKDRYIPVLIVMNYETLIHEKEVK